MAEARIKGKHYYDRNARERKFKVGDRVLILRPVRQNKLQVHWEGPVEIVHRISDTNYAVRFGDRRKQVRIYHPDYGKPFIVQCDASDRGLGAVLCQTDENGHDHPIIYASRKLSIREQAYSASEKECACLVWAARKFHCYLYGTKFTFVTDHCPLKWLQNMSPKNGRLLRWSLALQEFSFDVVYKKGKQHGNADCLSRYSLS